MRVINIVDSLAKVNFGIWNSAVSTAHVLQRDHGVVSELWFPSPSEPLPPASALNGCLPRQLGTFDPLSVLTPGCVVVSHGCWQVPTRLAHRLRASGWPWVYVPHGMLEPWSMQQKRVQKLIYYNLVEKRLSRAANVVRAVGSPELINLQKTYDNALLIPNGIEMHVPGVAKDFSRRHFLFMARLHHKKGIIPLVKAWKMSSLNNSPSCQLTIAGPDDGELDALNKEIAGLGNVRYAGAVYGADKQKLVDDCNCYILPSFSEGFPTSVVEAMGQGLIPVISEGCNFPEAFVHSLGVKTSPRTEDIVASLEYVQQRSSAELASLSSSCVSFIKHHYTLDTIARSQYDVYSKLLHN